MDDDWGYPHDLGNPHMNDIRDILPDKTQFTEG